MVDIQSTATVYSAFHGKAIAIHEMKNDIFANLGQGVAVIPEEGTIYAPVDGVITAIFPTKHVIGILAGENIEMLLHMGIGTAALKGKPFHITAREGDQVKAGDVLGTVDLETLKKERKDPITPILVTNTELYEVRIEKETGSVGPGDVLYYISKKE